MWTLDCSPDVSVQPLQEEGRRGCRTSTVDFDTRKQHSCSVATRKNPLTRDSKLVQQPMSCPDDVTLPCSDLCMVMQFSVKAFEAKVAVFPSTKTLSTYNAAYKWMVRENFVKLTDFNLLLDTDLWHD